MMRLQRVRESTDIAQPIRTIHLPFGPARQSRITCGSATSLPHSLRNIIIAGLPGDHMPVRPMLPGSALTLHHWHPRLSRGRHWRCPRNSKLVATQQRVIAPIIEALNAPLRAIHGVSHRTGSLQLHNVRKRIVRRSIFVCLVTTFVPSLSYTG